MDQANDTFNAVNKEIKKDYRSLRNRILSILLDHAFLSEKVVPTFPNYPVIPNERCGLWYCDPTSFQQTSYFKSTDGHTNQWDFSTRRLNFHLLPTIAQHGGVVIVDSTRRGKKIPDALSKTVPIWCAVLNSLMLEYRGLEDKVLFCPPNTVPPSEIDRIKKKIPSLMLKLQQLNVITGKEIYDMLGGKLLRPIWVYPGCSILESNTDVFTGEPMPCNAWENSEKDSILPIILCTASYQCQDGVDKRLGFTYVQGAADDHESWAKGLTPAVFWENVSAFKDSVVSEQMLERLIEEKTILESNCNVGLSTGAANFAQADQITGELYLGCLIQKCELSEAMIRNLLSKYGIIICFTKTSLIANKEDQPRIICYPLESDSKKSSRELRVKLPGICNLIKSSIQKSSPILVCCDTGRDISVGVILAALCENYDENWSMTSPQSVSKITIRKHLSKVITKLNGRNVNPSRATLNSINAYLM
ncbi:LAFE_0G07074g1_1 [Lachancea fermentati]|uniref:LAFE_0G07074g1_1 n=1 Tax=Lachancea fermentati TaxID=4955 RepID=A0A1G4MH91_LACFM|nr:LAFE_0G07074g1_1 [Lachancea fermentati]